MQPRLRVFISISVVILLVIAAHYIGWLHPVESFLRQLIRPGTEQLYTWRVEHGGTTQEFSRVEDLESAYTQLLDDHSNAVVDQAVLLQLLQENTQLREQLSFLETAPYTHVGAQVSRVIGKNIDPGGSTVILDRGERDGVQEGSPVIVGKGLLVGKVVRVDSTTSIVRLINDNESTVAATIMGRDQSIGLVEGGFGISVRMSFIPQNEVVEIGDIVVTSGLEQGIPLGLVIGHVESVEKEAYEPFQRAVLTPTVDLQKIQHVSIITNTQ